MTEELKPDTSDLLPCPFCGDNSAHFTHVDSPDPHGVRCPRCRASIGEHDSRRDAAIHWNTRPSPWNADMEAAPRDRHLLLWVEPYEVMQYGTNPESVGLEVTERTITTGYWDQIDGAWCVSSATWVGPFVEPVAWMSLPQPPEEG